MMFGIVLGIFNHTHAKDYVSVYFETVPQIIFLFSLFGYLVIIIIIKWLNPIDVSLLNTLIFMVLQFGGEIKPQNLIFSGQASTSIISLLINNIYDDLIYAERSSNVFGWCGIRLCPYHVACQTILLEATACQKDNGGI